MSELGKQFLEKSDKEIFEKKQKIDVKMPHVNKKSKAGN